MSSTESDIIAKEPKGPSSESGLSLYYDAADHFVNSFGRAVVAPLTGAEELISGAQPAARAVKGNDTTADGLGTMAGTAFDFVLGSMIARRALPGVSPLASLTVLNTAMGFLQPTQDRTLTSHLEGAAVGFGTGIAMGGVAAAWRPTGVVSRLLSGTVASVAGGSANVEMESKLRTGQFAGMPELGKAAVTWGGVALVLGGLQEGGGAAFGSMLRAETPTRAPATEAAIKVPATAAAIKAQAIEAPAKTVLAPASDVRPLAADKAPAGVLPAVSQQAVPSVPQETVIDRIRRIAQDQPWYSRVQKADTYMKCKLFSQDLSTALSRDGIENIQVATTDDSANHMPMHNFILAKTETGQIVHVDPTISQFVPNYPDVFIGTRPQLLDIARTSVGDIKVWDRITENRTNWDKIWAEKPLLYPKRFAEPSAEAQDIFNQKWGSAGVEMYKDHLAGIFEQAKTTPEWREYAVREFPKELVQRLDDAMAAWKTSQAAAATTSAAADNLQHLPLLELGSKAA